MVEVVVDGLDWQDTGDGFIAAGYRLAEGSGDSPWRLESPGSTTSIRRRRPAQVTRHRSSADAMAWADQLERDEVHRLSIRYHFTTSGLALVAFAVLAEAIGSIVGLILVAASFYVVIRSAGNGLGLVLKDAWGWTRLGPRRITLLERWVLGLAQRRRRRALASLAGTEAVRPLEPVR